MQFNVVFYFNVCHSQLVCKLPKTRTRAFGLLYLMMKPQDLELHHMEGNYYIFE